MRNAIVCVLVVALVSAQGFADAGPDQKHIESIKRKAGQCVDRQRRVVVETYDDRHLQGFISEARGDDFTLIYGRQTTTLTYQDVKKIKWQSPVQKPVIVLVETAAVVGVIFGLVVLCGGLKG